MGTICWLGVPAGLEDARIPGEALFLGEPGKEFLQGISMRIVRVSKDIAFPNLFVPHLSLI